MVYFLNIYIQCSYEIKNSPGGGYALVRGGSQSKAGESFNLNAAVSPD